ncbi:MAG: G8 domain-containing protein, partial [Planctomycetota bacterium]
MPSPIDSLRAAAQHVSAKRASLTRLLNTSGRRAADARSQKRDSLRVETLERRELMAASIATMDGDWFNPAIWSAGVPDQNTPAIIGRDVTVNLDGKDHAAETLVVHGDLVVPEDDNPAEADKTLIARWVHVNSGGEFIV